MRILAEQRGGLAGGRQPGGDDLAASKAAISRCLGHAAMGEGRPVIDDEHALAGNSAQEKVRAVSL
jgi:hypothetical protein